MFLLRNCTSWLQPQTLAVFKQKCIFNKIYKYSSNVAENNLFLICLYFSCTRTANNASAFSHCKGCLHMRFLFTFGHLLIYALFMDTAEKSPYGINFIAALCDLWFNIYTVLVFGSVHYACVSCILQPHSICYFTSAEKCTKF